MRIILYSYEYPPLGGGVGNAIKNLLLQFSKIPSIKIDFVTISTNGKKSIEIYSPNITFHYLPGRVRSDHEYHKQVPKDMIRFWWSSYWYTWKLIKKHSYDLSHFFGYPGGLTCLLFKWKLPYVISLRGVDVPGYNNRFKKYYFVYKLLSRIIWKFADKVVANSQGLKELALQTSPSQEILVVPNGIDTNKFLPSKHKAKKFTVTAGGTLFGKKKGLEYLIRGFARLHNIKTDTQLVLIGSGDLEDKLKELVIKLRIKKAVKFVGRQSNDWIAANLPTYHVFCLPSLNEGMSNAALEALSSGLPLLLTETGGTKEILQNNGYVIKKNSSNDIYEKLLLLYNTPKLCKEFGERSRKIAKNMSWEQVANSYLDIYKK